jgi:hypothetical protein
MGPMWPLCGLKLTLIGVRPTSAMQECVRAAVVWLGHNGLPGMGGDGFAAFGQADDPICGCAGPRLRFAGGPTHFDAVGLLRLSKAEIERVL